MTLILFPLKKKTEFSYIFISSIIKIQFQYRVTFNFQQRSIVFGYHRAFWLWYGVLTLEQAIFPWQRYTRHVHAGGLRLTPTALFMETLVPHQSHSIYRSTCHSQRATSIQQPSASGLLSLWWDISVCGSLTTAEGQNVALENAVHTSCHLGTEYKDSLWICDFVVPLLWAMACVIWRIKWLGMWKNSIPSFLVIYLFPFY